jgi:hypothetical protein
MTHEYTDEERDSMKKRFIEVEAEMAGALREPSSPEQSRKNAALRQERALLAAKLARMGQIPG